jgi:hypothetical protein
MLVTLRNTVADYALGDRGSIPVRVRDFSLYCPVQTVSYPVRTGEIDVNVTCSNLHA